MRKNKHFRSLGTKKQTFQSSGTKNEFHWKFRDENNTFVLIIKILGIPISFFKAVSFPVSSLK